MSEEINKDAEKNPDNSQIGKRRFRRGMYERKDTPIRLLDGLIVAVLLILAVLIVVFAIKGGYIISFDTQGGTEIAPQKLRYGHLVEEPEIPVKQGYVFSGWYYEQDQKNNWDFAVKKVGGDMTLIARWKPAESK